MQLITLRACAATRKSPLTKGPSTHLAEQWSTGYKAGFKEEGIARAAHHLKSTSSAPPTGLDSSTRYPSTTAPPLHGRPQKQSANSVESAGKFTNPRPKCRVVSGGYSGVMACDVTRAHALEPRHSARALPYSAEWRCSPVETKLQHITMPHCMLRTHTRIECMPIPMSMSTEPQESPGSLADAAPKQAADGDALTVQKQQIQQRRDVTP
ncbi:hypothetical protein THAR02_04140 [Trichoderma harzianum]|uniref:Uncharacterized protein n=1 Tax=Trichoderma harzianum TaxID=5544 RepID=A0A0F9ZU72_TRIHA|nr:hypothetical protein THAR02_04140 [Trichoderma harzianum]